MNRRQAAQADQWAAQDAAGNPVCGLCGKAALVFADPADESGEGLAAFDVCGDCNRAFRELAQAIAAAQEEREERAEVRDLVAQVEGQLELTEEDTELDGRTVRLASTMRALTADEWDVIFSALAAGEWVGVPTMLVADALREGTWTEGLKAAELAELRGVLARRS